MSDYKDDAQIKNTLRAIKTQLTATANPSELARLASAAAGLALNTNNSELLEQIKGVQAAIAKKEENAGHNISSKIASENFERQQINNAVLRTQQEYEERETRLKENYIQYDTVEEALYSLLTKETDLIKKANNIPESLTPDDLRRLKGENLTPEEQEEERKKFEYLSILGSIIDDTKKSNEYYDKRANEINEQLNKTIINEEFRKNLEQEKKKIEGKKTQASEALNKKLKPIYKQMDEEREELFKLAEILPQYAQANIDKHAKLYAKQYQTKIENDPNYKELEKLQEIVSKIEYSKKSKTNDIIINNPNSTVVKNLLKEKIDEKISSKEMTEAINVIKQEVNLNTKPFITPLTPSRSPSMQRLANKTKGIE
ncbi:hypothetical protein MA5_02715 [Rickettsia prowazekii str. GvV257]|uniref:RP278 family tick cell line-upregulated protein n=1 Tax=Rickettsia prowazekii TaxID=782 RepID=UPI000256C7EA|nr:hypothetical protein [Rickettsia prowazekii]AFE52719.1 hypothetical protein MA5_02715 [Rickettsia prowazekii str. GvV257]AFE53290.1 hypothetical protein MA7_01350 [Rickettsia prowazekii str. RpGvF24]